MTPFLKISYVLKTFSSISKVQYDVLYEPNVCKNDSRGPMFQENHPFCKFDLSFGQNESFVFYKWTKLGNWVISG